MTRNKPSGVPDGVPGRDRGDETYRLHQKERIDGLAGL